ncbi:pyridoxamine 5'-phosphate oxidase family protein [Pseudonocardia hispaniensis]|uniref:Pyridoxamine 5'-phosphate oxidase family protein n=1 Tax=Pseudonocardia hispaniensis TaxID=904933 RepID=A0ABW1J4M5_9PSEU
MSNEGRPAGRGEQGVALATIRSIVGEPTPPVKRKAIDRIDDHCRAFIAHSPFLCLATANARGEVDVSPRGDRPGFVQVLDERTLAIPERPGNRVRQHGRSAAGEHGHRRQGAAVGSDGHRPAGASALRPGRHPRIPLVGRRVARHELVAEHVADAQGPRPDG